VQHPASAARAAAHADGPNSAREAPAAVRGPGCYRSGHATGARPHGSHTCSSPGSRGTRRFLPPPPSG